MIERGKSKFFHGRFAEIEKFYNLMRVSKKRGRGSSLLFQGLPGIGKTSLIEECVDIADNEKWNVIELDISTFSNPVDLYQRLTRDDSAKKVSKTELKKTFVN